jgi:excisionase family DNA binding protein
MSIFENKITYKELAQRTPYSQAYLRKLVSERKIPFYKLNRSVFFDPEEIEEWLAKKLTHHAEV